MDNSKNPPIVLIAPFNIDFGVRYISSFLKTKGCVTYIIFFNQIRYTVEFFDNDYFTGPLLKHQIYPAEDIKLLIKLLKQLKPKLIGISVTSVTMRTCQRITYEIKKNLDSIVVWGGIHAIIAPEECIQYADIVCIGEGELPMWELAEKLRNKQPITGIKNLWIKNNGAIEKNELRPLIEDLDTLPFPDFIDEDNKFLIDSSKIVENPHIISAHQKNAYPIMTSRGCMFSCSYCCNSVIQERYRGKGPYLRRRSVDNVIKELRLVVENRPVRFIRFWDDIFTYDKDWIEEFCGKFLSEIGKPFVCYAHPKYTDRNVLSKLVKSGLNYIVVGIQSGSESVAKNVFTRNQSNQDILDFAKKIKELHICSRYDLITDNPYETELDQDHTVELLLKLPHPYGIHIYSLCYFPKTPLTNKALRDKIITEKDLEQYTSKAINNFHMFLPLSKNRKHLFWNCIKAMSVNKRFSKNIVRLCKKIALFKKYPKILICLSHIYLLLFKIARKKDLRKIDISSGKSKFLFVKDKLTFVTFVSESNGFEKHVCLKITNRTKKEISLQATFELSSANIGMAKTEWEKTRLKIRPNDQSRVNLILRHPELHVSCHGIKKQLKLVKDEGFVSGDGRLYVFRINYRILDNMIPLEFDYRIAGEVFCEI